MTIIIDKVVDCNSVWLSKEDIIECKCPGDYGFENIPIECCDITKCTGCWNRKVDE